MVAGQNVFLGPILFRESSFVLNKCSVLFPSDTYSQQTEFTMCSPSSEFATKLVTTRPEDAFFDLIASSILGLFSLSIMVKIAF